jgi:hypothetical protein
VYRVRKVLADKKPALFVLENLLGTKKPQFYYAGELLLVKHFNEEDFFVVKDQLKTRTVDNKKEILCSFYVSIDKNA